VKSTGILSSSKYDYILSPFLIQFLIAPLFLEQTCEMPQKPSSTDPQMGRGDERERRNLAE
jgi:hypothetical protein